MLLPPFFDLGYEDMMWEFADGDGKGVAGEGCSFTCNLISPHLTPMWVLRKPQYWVARALLPKCMHLETAVALLRRE